MQHRPHKQICCRSWPAVSDRSGNAGRHQCCITHRLCWRRQYRAGALVATCWASPIRTTTTISIGSLASSIRSCRPRRQRHRASAGANKTLADIYNQGYGSIAGAYGTNAMQTAGIQSGLGSDITNVLGNYTAGQGQTLKDIMAGNAAANNAVAQAGQTDASNLWGLLGAGVKADRQRVCWWRCRC